MVMIILAILFSPLILLILLLVYEAIISYPLNPPDPEMTHTYSEVVKLPFKQLCQIYSLNPERVRFEKIWLTEEDGLGSREWILLNYAKYPTWSLRGCTDGLGMFRRTFDGIYEQKQYIVAVRLSMLDTFRFNRARKHNPNHLGTERAILEAMQFDIDKLREQAQKQINEAMKINEEILEKMHNGRS